jgi:hypothetical protein
MVHRFVALGAILSSCALTSAGAQTAPATPATPMPLPTKAERVPDVRYFLIETIVAKPGAKLWTLISKHFLPAGRAAGVPVPTVYHTETGPEGTILISPLPGGPGDLAWSVSPDDAKMFAALAKQEGGNDKAMALITQYNEGIASRTREIVHEHTK